MRPSSLPRFGLDQRREAGLDVDGYAVAGQQVGVAPDRRGAALDALSRDDLAQRLVIVDDLERAEAELADVDWLKAGLAMALAAA